jgi:hypothetical protein
MWVSMDYRLADFSTNIHVQVINILYICIRTRSIKSLVVHDQYVSPLSNNPQIEYSKNRYLYDCIRALYKSVSLKIEQATLRQNDPVGLQ